MRPFAKQGCQTAGFSGFPDYHPYRDGDIAKIGAQVLFGEEVGRFWSLFGIGWIDYE
ncbi:MAG: hypothetical protein P1P89_09260 [Desulfobacterales bacterium]|nr:hypothetical protein [Desulfobacterales bacterium]